MEVAISVDYHLEIHSRMHWVLEKFPEIVTENAFFTKMRIFKLNELIAVYPGGNQ